MTERSPNGIEQVMPGDLRDVYGMMPGEELVGLIESLAPQVAMWKMAQNTESDNPFHTDSYEISKYVHDNYFLIKTRFIASGVFMLSIYARSSEISDCGITFTFPEDNEMPSKEFFIEERYFLKVTYPSTSDKYRFQPNFSPENLERIKKAADKFGNNTNLHTFYKDAISFWEAETGLPYPTDFKTPEIVQRYWENLNRLESRRQRKEAKEDLTKTWNDAKKIFDETTSKTDEESIYERSGATFNMVFTLEYGMNFDFLPNEIVHLECQTERDNNIVRDCLQLSSTLGEFVQTLRISIRKRIEDEREDRKTINEMWIEAQSAGEENSGDFFNNLLTQFGLNKTRLQKELVWDQCWVIEKVARLYNSLESKNEESLREAIKKNKLLRFQELEDIVEFLISTKPDYVNLSNDEW